MTAKTRGRPKRLTDDFLRTVTQLARQARSDFYPINGYIAAALEERVGYLAADETVRGWRKAATARRRQVPHDDSFLSSGELCDGRAKRSRSRGTDRGKLNKIRALTVDRKWIPVDDILAILEELG